MNEQQQRRIALSAAFGVGVICLILIAVLSLTGSLTTGTVVSLSLAVIAYGYLVQRRLRRHSCETGDDRPTGCRGSAGSWSARRTCAALVSTRSNASRAVLSWSHSSALRAEKPTSRSQTLGRASSPEAVRASTTSRTGGCRRRLTTLVSMR